MAKKKGRKLTKKEFLEWLKKDPEKNKKGRKPIVGRVMRDLKGLIEIDRATEVFKKKRAERSRKKEKAPFPYWLFFHPPELGQDPIMRPPDGWPVEELRRAAEPKSPWLGSPSLNEHLAKPIVEPLRGA